MTDTALRWRVASLTALVGLIAPALVLASQPGATAAFPDRTVTRSNPATIALPDLGPAVPATSPIVVEPGFGRVTDVDVTLTGLFHECPSDLVATLLGPGGQRVVLMNDAAGGTCTNPEDPVVVTFDDEAPTALSEGTVLAAGVYKPTDNVTPDPAPLLSIFDGQTAGGTWQLALEDVVDGDTGYVTGWSIEIDYNDTTAPTGTVSIDGGGASTGSTAVSLDLSAADPRADSTGVTKMRFSNDGVTWSPFQPYAASTGWTTGAGDGTKTVWAQYADGIGNLSVPVSDTIVLDTTGPTAKKLTPKKNATGVSGKTKVTFVANESLDPTTITRWTVRLTAHGTTRHAKVSYSADTKKVTVTPQRALAAHTTYKVKISQKVTDQAGNGFGTRLWTFTTGG